MKGTKKKIMPFLLALLMVFSISPYTVKAEGTTHTASDEESLINAIANAVDGDTIVVTNSIALNSGLEINKSITLDLNNNSLDCTDSAAVAAVTISGCQVTIKGNGILGGDPSGAQAKRYWLKRVQKTPF